jgi:hypothetical protein
LTQRREIFASRAQGLKKGSVTQSFQHLLGPKSFNYEDGGNMFLQNLGICLELYMVSKAKGLPSEQSPSWKPETSQ